MSDAQPEPIDWSVLNGLREYQVEGEPDLVQELVEMYQTEAPTLLSALREAVANGDAEKLRHTAHTLKGTSNNLGVKQVAVLSAELEKKGRSGSVAGAAEVLAQLEQEYERACQALDAKRER